MRNQLKEREAKVKKIFVIVGVVFLTLGIGMSGRSVAQCVDSVIATDGQAYPGDVGIHIPVYGRVCGKEIGGNTENLDAFSFALQYDQTKLVCKGVVYEVTDPNWPSFYDVIPEPDFFAPYVDTVSGYATLCLTLSLM